MGRSSESQAQGNAGQESCSLGGQAAVTEEMVDDRWVRHCRRVPQVMVVLSNLPEYSPHDFAW